MRTAPMPLLGDATDPTVTASLIGLVTALSGVLGWVLRQTRADVRRLITDAAKEREAYAAERDAEADRRDRRETATNRVLAQMADKLSKLVVADDRLHGDMTEIKTRLGKLEERTDEHRPLRHEGRGP